MVKVKLGSAHCAPHAHSQGQGSGIVSYHDQESAHHCRILIFTDLVEVDALAGDVATREAQRTVLVVLVDLGHCLVRLHRVSPSPRVGGWVRSPAIRRTVAVHGDAMNGGGRGRGWVWVWVWCRFARDRGGRAGGLERTYDEVNLPHLHSRISAGVLDKFVLNVSEVLALLDGNGRVEFRGWYPGQCSIQC